MLIFAEKLFGFLSISTILSKNEFYRFNHIDTVIYRPYINGSTSFLVSRVGTCDKPLMFCALLSSRVLVRVEGCGSNKSVTMEVSQFSRCKCHAVKGQ
jgi:hypothetical protein